VSCLSSIYCLCASVIAIVCQVVLMASLFQQKKVKLSLIQILSFEYNSFWVTVCKTVHPMLSDCCLSVLSVTLVYFSQTVGRIKMKLGMHVGFSPGHIVLGGEPAPTPPKGYSLPSPNFRPISVAAKWLHGSRCHCVCSLASAQATLC